MNAFLVLLLALAQPLAGAAPPTGGAQPAVTNTVASSAVASSAVASSAVASSAVASSAVASSAVASSAVASSAVASSAVASSAAAPDDERFVAATFFRSGRTQRPVEVELEGSAGPFDSTLFSCAGCHGPSGEGRREGGTVAADIHYGRLLERGYDRQTFCRALGVGVDPQGQSLARAMPRYRLEAAECAALWRHLRHLEEDLPPGVDSGEIRIAATMVVTTPTREIWLAVLRQELETINHQGGIYGRHLRLVGNEAPAAIRILVDGTLPPAGSAPDELLISVPPLREDSPEWELWQVETPPQRQLALLAADAARWRVLPGKTSEAARALELWRDAAVDHHVVVDEGRGCLRHGEPRDVLVLAADSSLQTELATLDACPGARRFVFVEPRLPLAAFTHLKQPGFLVVPFDPGAEQNLNAGAQKLARTLVGAFDRAGRKLRLPRLSEELCRGFARVGGGERALFDGVLLLPIHQRSPPRWLGSR